MPRRSEFWGFRGDFYRSYEAQMISHHPLPALHHETGKIETPGTVYDTGWKSAIDQLLGEYGITEWLPRQRQPHRAGSGYLAAKTSEQTALPSVCMHNTAGS